jgi:hypothetical protein
VGKRSAHFHLHFVHAACERLVHYLVVGCLSSFSTTVRRLPVYGRVSSGR